MPSIYIANTGETVEASTAVSVLNNLLRAGVRTAHRCGGKAQCGTCRYKVLRGIEKISPPTPAEKRKLLELGNLEAVRLGCQSYISGDISIRIVLMNTL
jgi:adenylate cyclase